MFIGKPPYYLNPFGFDIYQGGSENSYGEMGLTPQLNTSPKENPASQP